MGLGLIGAMGGIGKGLTEGSSAAYKQAMEDKKAEEERSFQRETKAGDRAFQIQREDIAEGRAVTRDRTRFDQEIEQVKTVHNLTMQYGKDAATEGRDALDKSSGDYVKAMKIAKNPEAIKFIEGIQKADIAKTESATSTNLRNTQIKAAANAAADRAEAKVDKKELQGKYAKLGELIAIKQTNPKADVSAQWNPLVIEITSLGGNPAVMVDTLLGTQTTEKVATKTGDDFEGSVTTTTTNPGARTSGALNAHTAPSTGGKKFVWQNGKLVQQ